MGQSKRSMARRAEDMFRLASQLLTIVRGSITCPSMRSTLWTDMMWYMSQQLQNITSWNLAAAPSTQSILSAGQWSKLGSS